MIDIRFKYNSRISKKLGVNAIVIYPFILFSEKKNDVGDTLYKHELEHIKQIKEYGILSFYISYIFYHLAGLIRYWDSYHSYFNNPYEIEARKAEKLELTTEQRMTVITAKNDA